MGTRPAKKSIDYTAMAHHQDIPDPTDTGDPSRPQSGFWHPEERDRGARFMAIEIEPPQWLRRQPTADAGADAEA